MSYIKTISETTGRVYFPAHVYAKANKTYYEKNKDAIVLKSILRRLGQNGKIPTLYTINKYDIEPTAMMKYFEIFKEKCQDDDYFEKTRTQFFSILQEIM